MLNLRHTTHNNRLYGIINNISINYLYQSLSFLPLLSTHDLYFGYTSSSSIALVSLSASNNFVMSLSVAPLRKIPNG